VLGHVKCALERLVQPRAGVAVLESERVGLLELAENLRLAEHHRIEAARDFEQVMQALRLGQRVKFIAGERNVLP
jgi:hypothetical protein